MQHRLERVAPGGLEVRPDGVGNRDQRDLRDLVERDAQHVGGLALVVEMVRRPDAAEAACAGCELEAPAGLDDRAVEPGEVGRREALGPPGDARDDVRGHLVQVGGEMARSRLVRRLARRPAAVVRNPGAQVQLGERRALRLVRDDQEVPVLRVRRGRRLHREAHALLEHLVGTGRDRSSRLRTARVVDSNSSGVRSSSGIGISCAVVGQGGGRHCGTAGRVSGEVAGWRASELVSYLLPRLDLPLRPVRA